jgi:isoaspartyl peptidase/L-asparaginase-like protein (Ntn-hydrolase superfamily)
VEILKLEDSVSLSGVVSCIRLISVGIRTAKRVLEDMPVVILSVSVASKSKRTGEGNDKNRWAIEGIDIAREFAEWKREQSPEADNEDAYE